MDADRYLVVMNAEEQYSVWLASRPLPDGWTDTGFAGTREECLADVERVWVDMRPRSLREAMKAHDAALGSAGEPGGR